MTNYMGRARLEKILFKYISDRPDLIKSLRVAAKEYGKAMIFVYRKFRGSEWLECRENSLLYLPIYLHPHFFGRGSFLEASFVFPYALIIPLSL